ncbi:MAG: hypothetical protein ABUL44_00120, partial [Flavobacterium sp.]
MIWTTEGLVFFGTWLLKKNLPGYGLLCIHAPILSIKMGTLLKLKWADFIDPTTNKCEATLQIKDEKENTGLSREQFLSRELSEYIQKITTTVFKRYQGEQGFDYADFVYLNSRTGKVLTTSTLKRELQKLYEDFKNEVYQITYLELKFRAIETNSFEIAWGRDMVSLYNYSKKAFIAVSKFLGHRTVAHTIKYLEHECIDNVRLRFDLYSPNTEMAFAIYDNLEDEKWLTRYLVSKKFVNPTKE